MRFRLFPALASALAIAASAAPAAPPAAPRSIYLDTIALPPVQNETTLNQAMGLQGVDGLVIVVHWSALETGDGAYDLSSLVTEAQLAMQNHLEIELSIRADSPPGWLAVAGARVGHFTYANKGGTKGCKSVSIAIPWDPVFQSRWKAMLLYVGQELKKIHVNGQSAYDDVKLVRLTGINMDSDELHLRAKDNDDCTEPNKQAWGDANYTPAALLQGWDGIVRSFVSAFPDKYFSVAIIDSTYPFPNMVGSPTPGPRDTRQKGAGQKRGSNLSEAQNQPLLADAHQILGDRLIVQNNSLYEDEKAEPETVYFARTLPALIAFQTNLELGPTGGASCDRSKAPCKAAQDFLKLLNTGIFPDQGLKADYIEVFAPNVKSFPSAIATAHQELFGLGGVVPAKPPVQRCPHGLSSCQ